MGTGVITMSRKEVDRLGVIRAVADKEYLAHYGRPVALYSDKYSIFRVNHPDHEGEPTQFTHALRTIDIKPIHANIHPPGKWIKPIKMHARIFTGK